MQEPQAAVLGARCWFAATQAFDGTAHRSTHRVQQRRPARDLHLGAVRCEEGGGAARQQPLPGGGAAEHPGVRGVGAEPAVRCVGCGTVSRGELGPWDWVGLHACHYNSALNHARASAGQCDTFRLRLVCTLMLLRIACCNYPRTPYPTTHSLASPGGSFP